MEYDRKSGTSSFYGRRSSVDALNRDFPSPQMPPGNRAHNDSASTFNNPHGPSRASAEAFSPHPTAGYNSRSFYDAGRPEPVKGGYDEEAYHDEPFDVFADFNNQGPRYSNAVFGGDDGYRPVHSPMGSPGLVKLEAAEGNAGPVEMVTVPALGPEWKSSEVGVNRKRVVREAKSEQRAQKWKEWRRGERGLCGRYFTRKFTAWFFFALCVAIAITLAFVLPRVPDFQINADTPLTNATASFAKTIPTYFNHAPANFSFPGAAQLQLDTDSSFLAVHLHNIQADIYDLQTSMHIGTGNIHSFTAPAKKFTPLTLPLNFSYLASNDSDQTWANWYHGCQNPAVFPSGKRPAVSFRLIVGFHIVGLIGEQHTAADVQMASCPITLSETAA